MIKTRAFSVGLLLAVWLAGCGGGERQADWQTTGRPIAPGETSDEVTITIGDVDPDTPTNRMLRIRPLADYISRELGLPARNVRVEIARSLDEVAAMMLDGRVDVFMDSSYPSLIVRRVAGSEVVLESLVNGERTYQTLIVAAADSGVDELDGLVGKSVALQETYSTSGFLLPAAMLLEKGFELDHLSGPDKAPGPDKIGFFFSGDEENTFALIREGEALAGALSSQDYQQLPDEAKREFVILARSALVPRKLASVRDGFDPSLLERLIEALLAIDEEDREHMMRENGWNWEFARLDDQSRSGVALIEEMIDATASLDLR